MTITQYGPKKSFWKWQRRIKKANFGIPVIDRIMSSYSLSVTYERGFTLMCKKRDFGSPVGIFGASILREHWSPKVQENGSAPFGRIYVGKCVSPNRNSVTSCLTASQNRRA